jgi:signal transduction histidine kinase
MGIRLMEHRARLAGGRLDVRAAPGGGTVVAFEAVNQKVIAGRPGT